MDIIVKILREPAIVMGVLALIGLLAQRETADKVILGTLKTILGFSALLLGIGAIVSASVPFSKMFLEAFELTGLVASDEAATGAITPLLGSAIAAVMGLSFVVNILMARFTPFKNVYLAGHKQWAVVGTVVLALWYVGLNNTWIIVAGAIIVGMYMAIFPEIIQRFTRQVSDTDDWAIAHGYITNILLVSVVSKYLGPLLGNPERKMDDFEPPKGLGFFRDMAATTFIIFLLVFGITSLAAGPEVVANYAADTNYMLFAFKQAVTITAGVLVVIFGVRMFLAEIIPAFKGISDKIIPGARPALDVPVLFQYSPTSMVVGFVITFIFWNIGMLLAGKWFGIVAVPSMTGVFFGGAVAGIYGNAVSGRSGSIIASIVQGLHWPIALALFYSVLPMADFVEGISFLCPDNMLLGTLITFIGNLF